MLAEIATTASVNGNTTHCQQPPGIDDFDLTTTIVSDYIAGFIYGITNNDHKAAMEQCFMDTEQFEEDVCTLVADFYTKDNQKVLAGLQVLIGDLPELNSFMAGCPDPGIQADYKLMTNWFNYWKAQGAMKIY